MFFILYLYIYIMFIFGFRFNLCKLLQQLRFMKQQGKTIRDYIYSSQNKIRDKFSLKNLLTDDFGLQRNYVSQQTQRTPSRPAIRPQTMYSDRVKLMLQEQNKREKIQQQIKRKRQQSSYKITRSQSGVQIKIVTPDDKIKMKKVLGRLNLLAEGNLLSIDEQDEIQTIFNFFTCLHQVNNHYQIAFGYISKKLKQLVYAGAHTDISADIKQLADRTKNQYLINFTYRNIGKTTYKNLSKELLKQTKVAVQKMHLTQKQYEDKQKKYEQIIKEKQQIIKKIRRQLKYYQQHPSQDLYPYVKKLERENKQMKSEIQELVYLKGENQYKIQIQETTNLLLSQQVEKLKIKIYELQLQDAPQKIQKTTEMMLFEENVANLKEMMDKSKLKMQGMKDQFDKLKDQNQNLINQRSILAKRAAVGFGQLTPRPNVKKIFMENNLNYQKYITGNKKNHSTENIIKQIVLKIKNKGHQQSETPQNIINANLQQNDFQDEQNWNMQGTIDYIDKTKKQIYKTMQSVQQVKNAQNRQKLQKQKAENKNKR